MISIANWVSLSVFFILINFEKGIICTTEHTENIGSNFTNKDKDMIEESKTKFEFQAEKSRVMKIIVNSLYKNKDIYLRELISNAQDALSKAHLESLKDPSYLDSNKDLGIWIKYDTDAKSLTIRDTGIGMTRDDLINHLGTIAKSGTSEFIDKIKKAGESNAGNSEMETLVGQFGVGFYSAFLVADKVIVISKHNNDDQYVWESDSESFSVAKDPRGNTLGRGTAIILNLKSHATEYLDFKKLSELVNKYSQFISYKILVSEEIEEKVKSTDDAADDQKQDDVDDVVQDDSKEKMKTIKTYTYHHLNKVKPIWLRDPTNVTEEEYLSLYQTLVDDKNAHYLTKIHFIGEGNIRFRALLFVPEIPPTVDTVKDHDKFMDRVKLYVKRVYIKSALSTIFPPHLQYIAGVIDSDDLPLNVARESIQHGKLMEVIRKKVVKKVIQNYLKLSAETYPYFYGNYSNSIKYGITIDHANRISLIKLLRFHSSYTIEQDVNMTSIDDYIKRAPVNRTQILYVTCNKLKECENSPFATPLISRGYEILYLTDPIDDYVMNHANEYELMKFHNVAKQGIKLDHDDSKILELLESTSKEYRRVMEFWTKNSRFKKYVGSVNISLDMEHACVLVADKFGLTGNMERIFKSQAKRQGTSNDQTSDAIKKKKHLILNVHHPIVKAMYELVEEGKTEKDDELNDLARTCYAVALLNSGYSMSDLAKIATIMENNAIRALGHIPKNVRIEIRDEIEKVHKLRSDGHNQDNDEEDTDDDDSTNTKDNENTESNSNEKHLEADHHEKSEL